MLLNGEGRVFVGQRLDSPGPAWQMPQGGIDRGESPRDAAFRELREETGVPADAAEFLAESRDWITYDLPADLAAELWGGRFAGQKQKWFLLRLTGPESLIDIRRDKPEFSRWTWVEPEALPGLIVPFKRAVYEAVLAEFLPLIRRLHPAVPPSG
jgi:putative (di)nucleoside polyphosphate hydrolase